MKEALKSLWMIIRGGYYGILLILGMLGIFQIIGTSEPNDINIVVTIVSCFAIEHAIHGAIKLFKE